MRQVKSSELGRCPKCSGNELDYGDSETTDAGLFYEVNCACGWYGQEHYNLEFDSYYEPEEV